MSQRRRILRRPAVRDRVGLSDSTIDRKEKAGEFPRRVRLGANSVGWYDHQIDDFMDSLEYGGIEPPEAANEGRRAEAADLAEGS